MEIFKGSYLLQWADRLWSAIITRFRSGIFCAAAMWLWRLWQGSFIYSFLTRPSALDARLGGSRIARALLWCANLVPNLLHKIYLKKPRLFDGSAFFDFADRGALMAICAMTLLMLLTPQELWNNSYALAFGALALALYWISGLRRADRRLSFEGIGAWIVIFGLIAFFSAFWSQSFSYSARFLFFGVTCALVLLVLVNAVENERQLMAIIYCVAIGLAINSAYALWQRVVGVEVDPMITDVDANASMPGRVYSFFENPNSYANLLVLFIPLMLAMFFADNKPLKRLGFLAVTGAACLALLMTYSRAGWLSLAFSVFILMLIACPRYTPLLILFGLAALPLLPDNIMNRLLTLFTGDTSIGTRRYIYSGTLGVIAGSPIFGVGLGAKAVRSAAYISNAYVLEITPFVHAHNIYLEIWAESGIFALLAFVLGLFYAFQGAARTARNKSAPTRLRAVCAGCAAGLAGSALFGMTDYAWGYPRVMVIYWLFIAIMCSAVKLAGRENTGKAEN